MTFSPYRALAAVMVLSAVLFARPTDVRADQHEVPWNLQAEVSYRVALDYWNTPAPPLCGTVQKILVSGPARYTETEQGRAAATHPEQYWERCDLITNEALPFSQMCPAVVHAVGHLMGLPDVADPASVMYGAGATAVGVELCAIEDARLAGFGSVAATRIEKARMRCHGLRRAHAKKRRVQRCWQNAKRVRQRLATYLHDPYIDGIVLPTVTYEAAHR